MYNRDEVARFVFVFNDTFLSTALQSSSRCGVGNFMFFGACIRIVLMQVNLGQCASLESRIHLAVVAQWLLRSSLNLEVSSLSHAKVDAGGALVVSPGTSTPNRLGPIFTKTCKYAIYIYIYIYAEIM